MVVDLNILNAKILLQDQLFTGGVSIDNGEIVKVGKQTNLLRSSDKIDAQGAVLLPGLVDPHVHLRDMDLAYKEDFHSGTCAAVAGGYTTVLEMPNTMPMTDSAVRLREKIEVAKRNIIANVGFFSAFPASFQEFTSIASEGAIGFKEHLHKIWGALNITDKSTLIRAIRESAKVNLPVAFHAEDKTIVEEIEEKLTSDGKSSTEDYLSAHSEEAELTAVDTVIQCLSENSKVHFCHVSLPETVGMISEAKSQGYSISCEITPHHLFLSYESIQSLRGFAITAPPLRRKEYRNDLWSLLVNGQIDAVATDHAPHTETEKKTGNVWQVPPGVPGLETSLALFLDSVARGQIELSRLSALMSARPCSLFNLQKKGLIWNGFDADLVLVNLKTSYRIDASKFQSRAKFSPFDGRMVSGKVLRTFVQGIPVYEDDEVIAKGGTGKIVGQRQEELEE